jgi:hypothetical protein
MNPPLLPEIVINYSAGRTGPLKNKRQGEQGSLPFVSIHSSLWGLADQLSLAPAGAVSLRKLGVKPSSTSSIMD